MFREFEVDNLEKSKEVLEDLIENNLSKINELLSIKSKTYTNFIEPYQIMSEELSEFLTPLYHLDSVVNSELTQKVYIETIPIVSEYQTSLSQNEKIYSAIKEIYENETLNDSQKKVLEKELKDFRLSGVDLEESKKNRLKEINLELDKISQEFSQNLINATNEYELIIENEDDIKELPISEKNSAKFDDNGTSKYRFTLQMPSYLAYMTYGSNDSIREELYRAYSTRAAQNGSLISKTLKLKKEKANILGFDNYAQLSIASKDAKSVDDVKEFLRDLAKKGKSRAKNELKELEEFAKEPITSYNSTYYSEKLRKAKFDIDEEYYREYFEKNSVLNGLFEFLNNLFGLEFRSVNEKSWHDDVKIYDIYKDNKLLSRIYFDLEARKAKSGGAWMNNWQTYYNLSHKSNLASAFVVCNFPPSKDDQPSLLRHSDVVTLFHEMGHALHHLLSSSSEPFTSGINGVLWDVIEFPSQFMEYFAYEEEVLKIFAKHYKSGQTLSKEDIDKLIKAKNFQSAMQLLRQVEFALFDIELYSNETISGEDDVQTLLNNIRDEVAVIKPPSYNKFQNGFSHIFAGGYSAGYYSYKWAEVLSADAFIRFIDDGVFNKNSANEFLKILSSGSSIDMSELFFEFKKDNPNIESLLKLDGII
jgi:oligopeptidase A